MKVKLTKTLVGEYGGLKGAEVDLPKYVADKYVSIGYAERLKPCNCDEPKEGEEDCGCDKKKEEAVVEPKEETAEAAPVKRKRSPRRLKK